MKELPLPQMFEYVPGWRCQKCGVFRTRDASEDEFWCCEMKSQRVLLDSVGGKAWHPIARTETAPDRLVVAVYPDTKFMAMLNCGHLFSNLDESVELEEGEEVGCLDCWRESKVHRRTSPPTRARVMVGVQIISC